MRGRCGNSDVRRNWPVNSFFPSTCTHAYTHQFEIDFNTKNNIIIMYEIFHRELAHDLFNARFSTITPRVDNAIAAAAADDVISISDVSPEKVSLLRDEFPVNFPRPFGMRSVRYVQRTRLLRTSYNASRIRSKRRRRRRVPISFLPLLSRRLCAPSEADSNS